MNRLQFKGTEYGVWRDKPLVEAIGNSDSGWAGLDKGGGHILIKRYRTHCKAKQYAETLTALGYYYFIPKKITKENIGNDE